MSGTENDAGPPGWVLEMEREAAAALQRVSAIQSKADAMVKFDEAYVPHWVAELRRGRWR